MAQFSLLLKIILILLSIVQPALTPLSTPAAAYEANYDHLGIPLASYYPEGITARTAWDVEIHDGKLFVGGGDYDANSGPVPIYHYDLETNTWAGGDQMPDEQIERFISVGDTLIAPGCDPREDWTFGNLYRYENGTWHILRNIPGGIHQLDVVEFEGKLFVGLGVSAGEYPIAVSEDGGTTFSQVTMYKDSKPLDTSANGATYLQIRVYDFFIYENSLYAFYLRNDNTQTLMELYQYRDGAFHYYSDLPQKLTFRRISYQAFCGKAQYRDTMYFTTGNLYFSNDMVTASQISFGEKTLVSDLRVIEDKLYVCVISPTEDGQYRTSIRCKTQTGNLFREIFYFTFPSPAQSFTYHDGVFYFGMGAGTLSDLNETNGTILKIYHKL